MSAGFLFVSSTPSTSQRQKELNYAEVKSYIARNAHHKRHRETRSEHDVNAVTRTLSLVPSRSACHRSSIPTPLCGNSDPFDCQIVPVTAITNQIISFAQLYHNKCWSPSFAPVIATSISAWRLMPCDSHVAALPAAKSVWDLFVIDQGTFWAAISIAVHELKHLVPSEQRYEIQKAGLQMKGKGLNDLRYALAKEWAIQPTINIVYHVKALFRESCGSGDLDAARLHAKSLNWLINNLAASAKPPSLLRVLLWSDAVYALRQLRRPVIQYADWMPQLSRDIWETARPLLAGMRRPIRDEPPESLLSSPLREAFSRVQYALHISKYLMLDSDRWESPQEKELIFLWITT